MRVFTNDVAFGSFSESAFRPDDYLPFPQNFQIPELELTPTMLQAHYERILINKLAGSDRIHPQFLNILSLTIKESLAIIFNLSQESGAISDDLSKA